MRWLILERKSAADLPESRFMRSGGSAEASVRNVGVHVGVVGPVEQVEELKPELEVDAFGDTKILVDVGIGLKEIRSPELHGLFVTPAAECGSGEVALGDCSLEPSAVVGRLLVAGRVGIVEVVAVRVVIPASRGIADRGVRHRRARGSAVRSVLANRDITVEVCGGERISGLEDSCAAQSPSSGDDPYRAFAVVQSFEGVVPTER